MRTEKTLAKDQVRRVASPPAIATSLVEPNKGDTTTTATDESVTHNIGFVVEHAHTGKALNYTKILTQNPNVKKGKDRYMVILFHRPTIEYKLGSVVTFEFGEYNGKMTATKVDLVSTKSVLSDFFDYISDPNLVEETAPEEISLSNIAKQFMLHTHTGTDKAAFKQFLISQEIYTVMCWLGQRRIIVRKL
jgi:hypothetical protein